MQWLTAWGILSKNARQGAGKIRTGISLCYCLVLIPLLIGCQNATVANNAALSLPTTEQVEERDPACAYYYFLVGSYAESSRKYEEALEAYEKALICDPGADYIVRKMPVLLLRMERLAEAVDWLQRYLVEHPDSSGSRMLLAKIFMRLAQFDEAVGQYRIIHEQHPEDYSSLLLLGELYLGLKRYDEAEKVLRQVLDGADQSYSARVMLGRLHSIKEDYDQAFVYYEEALLINWSRELLFEMAQVRVQQQNYDQALKLYQRVLDKDESNESARIGMVHVYLLKEDEESALRELNVLRETSENPQRVDLTIARLYLRGGQFERALIVLQAILAEEDLAEARYLLGALYFQQEEYDPALEQLAHIGPEAEEYEDAIFMRARIWQLLDKTDEAVRLMQEAVSLEEGRTSGMFVLLAALHREQKRNDLAAEVFTEALAPYSEDVELLYEYGLFLDSRGTPAEAMAVMKKVIEMRPGHAAALNYVGYTWADQSIHLDEALEYITKAVSLKPDNGYIRDSLGWVYFRLGRLEEARVELEKALELVPDDPAVLDHLGDVYLELGRIDDAVKSYQRCLELQEDEEAKEKVRQKLRLIEQQEPGE